MFDWIAGNPHVTLGIVIAISTVLLAILRWVLTRHAEYVAMIRHMEREETDVWPNVDRMRDEMRENHVEAVGLLREHGARIDNLERRMPNGQLQEIQTAINGLVAMMQKRGSGNTRTRPQSRSTGG